jgi:hypothetical protein
LKQNTAEIWKIAAVQLPLYLPVTLRKALGWTDGSKLCYCVFCSTLFQLCFLGNWFFFSVYHPFLNSLPLKWKRERNRAKGVWEIEQKVGIYSPMRMRNGWKFKYTDNHHLQTCNNNKWCNSGLENLTPDSFLSQFLKI